MARQPGKFYNAPPSRIQTDRKITGRKLLLVEGPDDIYFFNALLTEMGADLNDIQVMDYEGKTRLPAVFSLLMRAPEVEAGEVTAIGLVQDADGDLAAARGNIDSAWAGVGLDVAPYGHFGASQVRPNLSIGSFALPDCATSGDLDEMLFASVAGDAAHTATEVFMGSVGLAPAPKFYKRSTQVYLAAKPDLCRGSGRGAENGYFDLAAPGLGAIRQFVTSLMATA